MPTLLGSYSHLLSKGSIGKLITRILSIKMIEIIVNAIKDHQRPKIGDEIITAISIHDVNSQ